MKKLLLVCLLGSTVAGFSGVASARDNVSVYIGLGTPYAPLPVVQPVYYSPQPIYVRPDRQEHRYWEEHRAEERREYAWRERERGGHDWRERQEWSHHGGHEHHGWERD